MIKPAFAALLSAAALYSVPAILTAPGANATVGSDCMGSNQTYETKVAGGHSYEACTTTDKNGDKTKCSYVDGKAQGCIAVPLRKPRFNVDPSVVAPVAETPSAGGHDESNASKVGPAIAGGFAR